MYTTHEEASNRLRQTYVMFEGRLVYVFEITGRTALVVNFREFPFGDNAPVGAAAINDPRFKRFVTPPLGFANVFERGRTHAAYVRRHSARRMQQGLVDSNVHATGIDGSAHEFSRIVKHDGFDEMIAGRYPTFDEVRETLIPNSSIGIDRDYALGMGVEGYTTLYHRLEPLALVMRGILYLRPDRLYAREQLLEAPFLPNDIQNL